REVRGNRPRAGRIVRKRLCPRERGRVDGRLGRTLLAEPRTDVENERDHRDQEDHEDSRHHGHLTVGGAKTIHSRRSLVVLVRFPALTVQPRMLIEYGYDAVTVTSL